MCIHTHGHTQWTHTETRVFTHTRRHTYTYTHVYVHRKCVGQVRDPLIIVWTVTKGQTGPCIPGPSGASDKKCPLGGSPKGWRGLRLSRRFRYLMTPVNISNNIIPLSLPTIFDDIIHLRLWSSPHKRCTGDDHCRPYRTYWYAGRFNLLFSFYVVP